MSTCTLLVSVTIYGSLMHKTPDAEQLWVLDSVPGKVDPEESDGEVEQVLQTLQCLPSSIPSRKYVDFPL